jgi:hypothetical protein
VITFAKLAVAVLGFFKGLFGWLSAAEQRQAGRNELAAEINKEAADASERMARANAEPRDRGTTAQRLRDGEF